MPEKKERTAKQIAARRARNKRRRQKKKSQAQNPNVQNKKTKVKKYPAVAAQVETNRKAMASHGKGGMAMSDYIACPGEYPQVRFPDPGGVAASILKTRLLGKVTWNRVWDITPAYNQTPYDWTGGHMHFFVFGQLARAYMYGPVQLDCAYNVAFDWYTFFWAPDRPGRKYGAPTTLITVDTKSSFDAASSGPTTAKFDLDFQLNIERVESTYPKPYLTVTQRPVGLYKDKTFLWINPGEAIYMQGNWNGGGIISQSTSIYYVDPNNTGDIVKLQAYKAVYNTTGDWVKVYTFNAWGYYAFEVNTLEYASVDVTLFTEFNLAAHIRSVAWVNGADSKQMAMIEVPAAEVTASYVGGDARRTACSLLVTNLMSNMLSSGNIQYGRVKASESGMMEMARLEKSENAGNHRIDKGVYTFMEFDEGSEAFSRAASAYGGLFYAMDFQQFVHHMVLAPASVSDTGSFATETITFATRLDVGWEFRTSSQLYKPFCSKLLYQDLITARTVLNQSNAYFYENPLHLKDIARYIRQAWSGVRGNARTIASAANLLAPGPLHPLITALGDLLQR